MYYFFYYFCVANTLPLKNLGWMKWATDFKAFTTALTAIFKDFEDLQPLFLNSKNLGIL